MLELVFLLIWLEVIPWGIILLQGGYIGYRLYKDFKERKRSEGKDASKEEEKE